MQPFMFLRLTIGNQATPTCTIVPFLTTPCIPDSYSYYYSIPDTFAGFCGLEHSILFPAMYRVLGTVLLLYISFYFGSCTLTPTMWWSECISLIVMSS